MQAVVYTQPTESSLFSCVHSYLSVATAYRSRLNQDPSQLVMLEIGDYTTWPAIVMIETLPRTIIRYPTMALSACFDAVSSSIFSSQNFVVHLCAGTSLRGQRVESRMDRFERRQRMIPAPLPVRLSGLSIPICNKDTKVQPSETRILKQSQSGMMRLPREIRDMIYLYVLGNNMFHIVLRKKRLGYVRCNAVSSSRCTFEVSDGIWTRGCYRGKLDEAGVWTGGRCDGDIVPLLRSCRQM
jgi:hypothetical protein